MWVAVGLIYSDGLEEGSDEEDIANCCFDMLCNKSFFDYNRSPFFYNKSPYGLENDYYTMHDMLNCLACHISHYECCRIVDGTTPSLILDNNTIRHISITCSHAQLHDLANIVSKFKHLRTLCISRQQFEEFIQDACKSPRRIRVLIMDSNLSDRCLKSISDFVKIRFLQIRNNFLQSLSMRKFYFLQVLMGEDDALAKDANKLTNLRHLYEVHEYTLFSVAKVGKLTSLQELCFPISTKPGHRIEELMNMDNLRKLTIKQLSNVRSLEKANMVNLVKKRYLISLELDWNVANNPDDDASNPDLDQPVLAALQPYPTIRELTIRGYKGGRPAPWMDTSLSLLGNLQLNACTSLEELPSLWKLPCLKFLKLNEMNAIRSLGCHFSSQIDIQFPVLEQLGFYDLPLLEEWNGADDYIWFPHLKSFKICDCPKLKKIPDLPLSIKNLTLENLGLEALPRSYNYKCSNGSRTFGGFQRLMMSLETLQISECPKIVQIGLIDEDDDHLLPSSLKELTLSILFKDDDLASYLQGLTLLTGLSLYFSPGVESLPLANELEHLTALQRLYIKSGETLTSPGGLYIIKSLTSLSISDCPKFLSAAEVESEEFLKDKTRKHAVSSSSVFDHSASDKVTSILPSSLEYLSFTDSGISQESLGRCLQGLSSLKDLKVSGCHRLVSLPNIEYLHNLTALQKLRIYDCKELCELESLTGLASLRILEIKRCSKLATTTEQSATKKKKGALPSLEDIDIDDIFYLPMIPISEKLKTLYIISSDKELTCFPSEIEESLLQYRKSLENLHLYRMSHLQSLPASLESFSSLKFLRIHSAPELKSLPRMPASLERLTIYGCSAKLEKRYQKNIGRDCPNIKYIEITADKEDKAEVC
ncbi:hypothetical protein ZIOFF_025369 [Zingiber officinale]|uniref:Uncharacterized protein n=1 Tax=Zingiber officinale TaxID=94328 RepID=A0A8J5H1G0_ZINOF|nr:hypothetical protein ZIOFF_025369 [Zingiber officinale]